MSNIEQSHRVGKLALAMLKDLGLSATARHYEVIYSHVDGRAPALSRDLQKFLDVNGRITPDEVDTLYHMHISRADLARNIDELATGLQLEIDDLFEVIEAQGESTHQRSTELGDISNQIRQTAQDYPAVGTLLESVVSITRKMRDENLALENSLAASTTEITNLRRNVESIQREALSDPLTGISNRKSFDQALVSLIEETRESGRPLALIMADVDHFKKFNDRWGHQTGDQVLRLVAEVMNANIKGQDMLARYGGEEFAILLPGTSLENAFMLADRIRRAVESRRLKKRQSNEDLGVITMSMGIASYFKNESPAMLVERADKALYIAKERGRNRVIDERDIAPHVPDAEAHIA